MSNSISACLSIALRSVRESMVHDSEDRQKEAFCQYLSNIMYICGVIKDEVWERDLQNCYSQDTLKLFKLSSQCLERAQDLLRDAGSTEDSVTQPQSGPVLTPAVAPSRKISQDSVDQSSFSFQPNKPNESQPNALTPMKQLHSISSPPISPNFQRRVQYIDDARRGNSQLLAAYRARMEKREKQMANSRFARKTDKTTMNLSLFRKMAENIEIAKARQKSLQKKKFERQQRLREEADRRMGPSSSLTTDEQLKKELYVKILEFEQETMWFVSLRDQLKARPEDASLIQHIINQVLGTKEHPLTKCLNAYQFEIHQQLTTVWEQSQELLIHITNLGNVQYRTNQETTQEPITSEHQDEQKQESDEEKETVLDEELPDVLGSGNDESNERTSLPETNNSEEMAKDSQVDTDLLSEEKENEYKKVLESIVKKVQFSLETLHSLFLLVYEPFTSAAGQDLCLASVEYAFFRPLWPSLLNLYRLVNYRREMKLTRVFRRNTSCTPKSLNVPDRLCLDNQNLETGEERSSPYQPVVDELQSLKNFTCPLEKLECIVRTNRFIVECVEEYYEAKGKSRNSSEAVIGCDDLLPILSFVIIRSNLPQLVSECHAMEDFISSDYLMGEEGYSLTTFQTALAYLETLVDQG